MKDPQYPLQVEQSFKSLKENTLAKGRTTTSTEDVLRYMYENKGQIWHMSWEFIGKVTKEGKYLSHRAPARASDLAIFDPLLVEDRKIGRFKAYRLRLENEHLIEKRLGGESIEVEKGHEALPVENCEHGLPTYVACPYCKKV